LCYKLITVSTYASGKQLIMLINGPLEIKNRDFQLCKLVSLPYMNNVLNKYVSIDTDYSFFAISKSRQRYFRLTDSMLSKCRESDVTMLPVC
jgi:hypothetical protein